MSVRPNREPKVLRPQTTLSANDLTKEGLSVDKVVWGHAQKNGNKIITL